MTEDEFRSAHSDAHHRDWEKRNTMVGLPPASAICILDIADPKTGRCRLCGIEIPLEG